MRLTEIMTTREPTPDPRCAAILGKDGHPEKLPEPLFGPRDDYSEHQRDPKVIYNEEKDMYYILIGAQTLDKKGTILIYKSKELLSGWSFAGQLHVPGYESFGGMWECPYIVNISGKDLLIFSPQYTKLPGRAESTNHNVYLIGTMDYDTLTFTPDGDYRYLDFGFDFYAAQGASNVGDPDKAILIGWIGLPDNHYCTEPEDWEGTMGLPRELRIKDGKLIQTPVSGVYGLRDGEAPADGTIPAACEIEVTFGDTDADFNLFTKADGTGGLTMHYDAAKRVCTFDKSGMINRCNEQIGEVLDMPLENGLRKLDIFVDRSTVEYFANDGEATFSAHSYPTAEEFHYTANGAAAVKIWNMKASVKLYFYKAEDDRKLPAENVAKIREYQKAGHLFGLCTGRQVGGLTPFITGFVEPDFYITSSGANIVDKDLREIRKRGVDPVVAQEILDKYGIENYRFTLDVEGDICVFAPMDYPGKYYVVKNVADCPRGLIHQVSIHTESLDEAERMSKEINEIWGDSVNAFQNVIEIDIAPKGCSKGKGVEFLREYMRETYGEIKLYGIGDSINDLPLLEASDVSYTFPYAPKVVQDKATKVVETIVDALEDSMND